MDKKYSKKDIKNILKKDVVIPEQVNARIKDTYKSLDLPVNPKMYYYKKRRRAAALIIAAAAIAVLGTLGFGVNGYYQKVMEQEGNKVKYTFSVDYEMTPYDISVEPGWLPDGYKTDIAGPYAGKAFNDATGGVITMIPVNGATIDQYKEAGDFKFPNVSSVDKTTLQSMETHIITSDEKEIGNQTNILLFNEQEGYLIQIYMDHVDKLSKDDMVKVAEKAKITKLETQTAYRSDEEKKEDKDALAESKAIYQAGVSKENVHAIGEEVRDPQVDVLSDTPDQFGQTLDLYGDTRYTVESVKVLDKLDADKYPKEYFRDYENEIVPGLNEDGTLKPYERLTEILGEDGKEESRTYETVDSKFVEVKMKAKNMRSTVTDMDEYVVPDMKELIKKEDGNYAYPDSRYTRAVDEKLMDLHGSEIHGLYFDKPYYTEGIERLKDFSFRQMQANEEIEYTVLYVVDEDKLDNMMLQFFSSSVDYKNRFAQCYVTWDR